ncbi:MAG: fluoride efflux transporter CrcB [Muribaculaceae bacterium]|nr:fluoride efflux transporter CrcB [Muribaculaceae bacterium]
MSTTLYNILIVGAGSCMGGMARYAVSRAVQAVFHATFPWGTLAVNIIGCFIIGLVYGFIDKGFQLSDTLKLLVTVGFCGGFTTFSTFMHENYLLFTGSDHLSILLYTILSIALGFLMVYTAYYIARIL